MVWGNDSAARSHPKMPCPGYATGRTLAGNCYAVGTARSRSLTDRDVQSLRSLSTCPPISGGQIVEYMARRHASDSLETSLRHDWREPTAERRSTSGRDRKHLTNGSAASGACVGRAKRSESDSIENLRNRCSLLK